jgi:predicted TIM-barrel fold metal-dependent hydrolase
MATVIDVHEHIFRGMDIPLKGYLLSRAYPRWNRWAVRLLAPLLARCIRRRIERDRIDRDRIERCRGSTGHGNTGLLCRLLLFVVRIALGKGYRTWADILSMGDVAEIARKLDETYAPDGISLTTPLVIDYEYWFRNSVDTPISEQIDCIASEVVEKSKGRFHPFVPFDPVREVCFRRGLPTPDKPYGPPETCSSMAMVRRAVEEQGFIGVKLYHSLGYRPTGNAAVDARRRTLFRDIGLEPYCVIPGEEIDAALEDLYRYCSARQVPITVHCGSDGIESFPGASFVFGKPDFWIPVLAMHPDLHVNLAHFGWSHRLRYTREGTWTWGRLRGKPDKNWLRIICEIMERFPHLYADVAHHEILGCRQERRFATDYRAIDQDFPGLVQKRLLFGMDWHVIVRLPLFRRFKSTYMRVLGQRCGWSSEQVDDFLGGNALRFLGLLPLDTRASGGWTGNRRRLADYYAANHIAPPRWFVETD